MSDPRLGGHILRSGADEPRTLRLARRLTTWLLHAAFRLRVHGLEHLPPSGPVILAGNHSSFLDGPFVFIVLPRPSAFLIKHEMYVGPLKIFLDLIRQIPVHRGVPDRTALRRGLTVLADGGVLGMFPEGTRGSGNLENIQHGIGYLALKARCPVVPVACFGTGEAMPSGSRIPKFGAPIDVVFGAPIHLDLPSSPVASRKAMAETAEQIRIALLDHLAAAAETTGRTASGVRRSA